MFQSEVLISEFKVK